MTPEEQEVAKRGIVRVTMEFELATGNLSVAIVAPSNAVAEGVAFMGHKEVSYLAALERAARSDRNLRDSNRIIRGGVA